MTPLCSCKLVSGNAVTEVLHLFAYRTVIVEHASQSLQSQTNVFGVFL